MRMNLERPLPGPASLSIGEIRRVQIFGILVLFCILAEEDESDESTKARTHPDLGTRTTMMLGHFVDDSTGRAKQGSKQQYSEIIAECARQVRLAWRQVRGDAQLAKPVRQDRLNALLSEVSRLEPQLIASAEARTLERYGRI